MGFLSTLGKAIALGEQLFLGFAPTLTKTIPGTYNEVQVISKDLAAIGDTVTVIQALRELQGMSGADAAKAAAPLVAQVVLNSSLVAGKPIQNKDLFNQGCTELGGAIADILQSIHPSAVDSVASKVQIKT